MAKLPEFLLRALYVKGSLQCEGDGFIFHIKNELGTARIIGARSILLDRKPIPNEQCSFIHADLEATFTDVTEEISVLIRKGEALAVNVTGWDLRRGRHTLGENVIVKDMGKIIFSVNDQTG